MNKNFVIEDETIRAELLRRGFEFYLYVQLPPNCLATDAHMHDAIEFIYVTEGSIISKIDGNEVYAEAGDLVLFRSRGVHSIKTCDSPKNRYYILKISTKLLRDICPKDISAKILFRFSAHNPDLKQVWKSDELKKNEIAAIMQTMINTVERGEGFSDISLLGQLIGFLYGILKSIEFEMKGLSSKLYPIYECITYINSNFSYDITAEDVAKITNVSYSSFARMFKRATGKTFKEYLNVTRTNEAEILLKSTDLTISDIATRCGYNNVSHFVATYKRYKGRTPLSER